MFSKRCKTIVTIVLLAQICYLFFLMARSYEYGSKAALHWPNTAQYQRSITKVPSSTMDGTVHSINCSQRGCLSPHCLEYLSDYDRACIEWCGKRALQSIVKCSTGDCIFMRGEGRAPVALISLPGSGNTWVRGLLEKATGICTGSVYCDGGLRNAGFIGEGVRSGSVLAVKTHHTTYKWIDMENSQIIPPDQVKRGMQPQFGAAILLLRNSYHALLSEWNRRRSRQMLSNGTLNRNETSKTTNSMAHAHIGTVNQQNFDPGNRWNPFIKMTMGYVAKYIENVILKSPPEVPKLVVRYEDFQKDRVGEVCRVLDFLHFPYSRESVSQRLEEDFSTFHRNRHTEFEAFTHSQTQFIDTSLRHIMDTLSTRNSGETYGIEEYLRYT